MLVLVTYDVATLESDGRRRLRKIAKACVNHGVRVQKSVFECSVSPAEWEMLKAEITSLYEPKEDSLRFYYLGANWKRRVEHHGRGPMFEYDDPLII